MSRLWHEVIYLFKLKLFDTTYTSDAKMDINKIIFSSFQNKCHLNKKIFQNKCHLEIQHKI